MADERVAISVADVWPAEAADEGVEEGVVVNWFTREGGSVSEGETVCEIQLEKVSIDVPAPATGTLVTVEIGEDEAIREDSVLGYIEPA